MKKLSDIIFEEQEHAEKELRVQDKLEDTGIEAEEKRDIINGAEEKERIKEDKKTQKEDNERED